MGKPKDYSREIIEQERLLIESLKESTFFDDTIGGIECESGFLYTIKRAAYIASEIGLGGCRSLSEFINMIDNEDPLTLDLFTFYLNKKRACENDIDGKLTYDDEELTDLDYEIVEIKGQKRQESKPPQKVKVKKQSSLETFLMYNGVSRAEIEEAKGKVDVGEIKDFSWITKDKLLSDDFDFEGVLKDMTEQNKRLPTFKLNLSTFKPLS